MPDYNGFPIHVQIPEVKFEAAVYKLLRSEPNILCSRLLYHRVPLQHAVRCDPPTDIAGRRLLVFERAQGENNVWFDLDLEHKVNHLSVICCVLLIISRPIFLRSLLVSAHHSSTSSSRSTLRLRGSTSASLSRNPSRSLFPWHPRASFASRSSRPKSKRQSATWVT